MRARVANVLNWGVILGSRGVIYEHPQDYLDYYTKLNMFSD